MGRPRWRCQMGAAARPCVSAGRARGKRVFVDCVFGAESTCGRGAKRWGPLRAPRGAWAHHPMRFHFQ
eukprot:8071269-Pyramimonas_sp.AAC.1